MRAHASAIAISASVNTRQLRQALLGRQAPGGGGGEHLVERKLGVEAP
jgi:hypothetical protein